MYVFKTLHLACKNVKFRVPNIVDKQKRVALKPTN